MSEITGSRRWYVQSLPRAAHGEAQPSGGLGIRKFFSAVFASPSVSHEGAAGYQVVGPVRKSDLVVVVARATTLEEARELWSALNQRGVLHLRPAAPSSSARGYAQLTEALQGVRGKGKTSHTHSSSPSKSPAENSENSSSRLFALFSERSQLGAVEEVLVKSPAECREARDKAGRSLLHHAVALDDAALAELAIRAGLEVGTVDQRGSTPLHLARSVECAMLLLNAGADANAQNERGNTPLHSISVSEKLSRRQKERLLYFFFSEAHPDEALVNLKGIAVSSLRPTSSYALPELASAPVSAIQMQSNLAALQNATEAQCSRAATLESDNRALQEQLRALRDDKARIAKELRLAESQVARLNDAARIHSLTGGAVPTDSSIAGLLQINQNLSKDLELREDRMIELLSMIETMEEEKTALIETVTQLSEAKAQLEVQNHSLLTNAHSNGGLIKAYEAQSNELEACKDELHNLKIQLESLQRTALTGSVDHPAAIIPDASSSSSSTVALNSSSTALVGHSDSSLLALSMEVSSVHNFQTLLDRFTKHWQVPQDQSEIVAQAVVLSRVLILVTGASMSSSLESLYQLLAKYALAPNEPVPVVSELLYPTPLLARFIVSNILKARIFALQTAVLQTSDRLQLLATRQLWKEQDLGPRIDAFGPILERHLIFTTAHELLLSKDAAAMTSALSDLQSWVNTCVSSPSSAAQSATDTLPFVLASIIQARLTALQPVVVAAAPQQSSALVSSSSSSSSSSS
ncbi:MAG: hypothetical protein Q8P67_26920, partial [archaeon]|nr:hypothetical protein [archaeon]